MEEEAEEEVEEEGEEEPAMVALILTLVFLIVMGMLHVLMGAEGLVLPLLLPLFQS